MFQIPVRPLSHPSDSLTGGLRQQIEKMKTRTRSHQKEEALKSNAG